MMAQVGARIGLESAFHKDWLLLWSFPISAKKKKKAMGNSVQRIEAEQVAEITGGE